MDQPEDRKPATYLVKSDGEVHEIVADYWESDVTLRFYLSGTGVATFQKLDWWKREPAPLTA